MVHARFLQCINILTIIFLLTSLSCDRHAERQKWSKNFFTELAKDSNSSLRMFNIWFGGDRTAFTKNIWLGGKQSESDLWYAYVDDFLLGQRQANTNAPFLFEIVLDQDTYNTQKLILERLKDKFPTTFKITMLSEIPAAQLPPKEVIEHAYVGNPGLASDALRLWYLPNKSFATNIYLDVDLFLNKMMIFSDYPDYKIFGREVSGAHIFYHQAGEGVGNDYLIDKGAPEVNFVNLQNRGLARYRENAELLNHFKNRAAFVTDYDNKTGFEKYWHSVTNLYSYQMQQGDKLIDLVSAVIDAFGPNLWSGSPDAVANTAASKEHVSAQEWKGGDSVTVDTRSLTKNKFNLLLFIQELEAKSLSTEATRASEIILALNILGWDHGYFSRFSDRGIADQVEKRITELWQEAEQIIETNLGRNRVHAIALDLKKATGGLFLALKLAH